MPVVVPRTPASGMSASSQPSKPLLASHEQRSKSSNSLSPLSALSSKSSHPPYHKLDPTHINPHPTTTRRALHYNTPQAAVSPRSANTASPFTASATTTASHDLLDLDNWQCDTETQLERLIVNAELVLSQEKLRAHIGVGGTADSFEQLDDKDQRELRDLIAQARKLEHGVVRELDDIQRSVAEEKDGSADDGEDGSGSVGAIGFSVQSSSTLQRVREMSEYISLLEAKVDDLQSDLDRQQPALALSSAEKLAKQQLRQQLEDERQRYEQLEDRLQQLQTLHRSQQQLTTQLTQQLDDLSGSYDATQALLAEEKDRGARWLREKEETRADKRQLDDRLAQSTQRETDVRHECDRRLAMYERVKRNSVRMQVMGVLSVGLVVLWAGVQRWMNEYVRSQPQLYTF